MCAILGILDIKTDAAELRRKALNLSKLQRHRGPDWTGVYSNDKCILVHERLSIVDPMHGAQPLYNPEHTNILAVNGEIYNHQDLKKTLTCDFTFQTGSDCEIILAKYKEKGIDFLNELNGIFAFILYDAEKNEYLIARDHIGIIPLYTGYDKDGNFYVAKLRSALEDAVKRQLMSDVPYGVLLSGGLDSSVISAVAKKFADRRIEEGGKTGAWWPQLHSFAIGLKGAPDLEKAKEVADYIGTVHHEINFTVQEGIDALRDVIYHIETYDVTTIRASTPMYLMARYIKSMGIKMVLSGEGSDEIFGGYLYFHKAPNAKEFHEETVRKLSQLHLYDCLRANKSMMAWGVEPRVPFLDREFIDVAMSLNPKDKMCSDGKIEKYILREAFEDYLPKDVCWRQKEQFSDGVGYSWIDSLREYAETQVSDQMLANAKYRYPINTPLTKEAYFYRSIFAEFFPLESAARTVPYGKSVACSTPAAIAWDKAFAGMADPSGRAVTGIHEHSYKEGMKF